MYKSEYARNYYFSLCIKKYRQNDHLSELRLYVQIIMPKHRKNQVTICIPFDISILQNGKNMAWTINIHFFAYIMNEVFYRKIIQLPLNQTI